MPHQTIEAGSFSPDDLIENKDEGWLPRTAMMRFSHLPESQCTNAVRGTYHRLTFLGAVWLVIGPAWIILGDVRNKPLVTDLGFGMLVFGFVLSAVGLARWVREIR